MIKKYMLFFCFCFVSFQKPLKCQAINTIDSLLNLLNDENIDSTQLQINREIAKYYYGVNTKKALEYYNKSKKLSESLGEHRLTANSNYSLGICYGTMGNFEKSLEHLLYAARYFEENQNNRNASLTYSDIASLYTNYKNFDKAQEYYAKSENLIKLMDDTFEMGYLYLGMSQVYYLQEKYDSAIAINFKTLNLTSSLEDKSFIQSAYSNIGLLYKKKKDYVRALRYTDSAFLFAKNDNISLSVIYNNYGSIYSELKKYHEAEKAFFRSLELCRLTNNTIPELENYKNLSELYKKSSDYKSQTIFLTKYYNLKDSLYNKEKDNQFTQLETDYQIEQKDKLIIKSNLETIKEKNARNILLLISLFAVILLGLLYTYYKKSQNKNQVLQKQNNLIDSQKTELEKLNHVKDRLFSIISHDLRNPLNTLKSYLMLSDSESISADKKLLFKNQTITSVVQTGDLLDNLLTWANLQIKNTSANIVPVSIQECVGDVVSVVEYQAKQKDIQIIQKVEPLMIPANMDILSIALRNLITNAIKFSFKNSDITIKTLQEKDHTLLVVEDHGVGISIEKLELIKMDQNESTPGTNGERGSGLGLYLVKEMLNKINAQLQVESTLGKGSKFIIKIPS